MVDQVSVLVDGAEVNVKKFKDRLFHQSTWSSSSFIDALTSPVGATLL